MAFRIHDVTVHLMPAGAPGACTCGPASPGERPGCPGASGPKPPGKPKPKGTAKPVPPERGKDKRKALAFLRAQLRSTLAPPAP